MKLSSTLHNEIVDFFISLPNIQDSRNQRAFIESVGLDSSLQNQICFGGSPSEFFQLLVPMLIRYGTLEDGREALEAVLETAKNFVGQNRKVDCDKLLQKLRQGYAQNKRSIDRSLSITQRTTLVRRFSSPLKSLFYRIIGDSKDDSKLRSMCPTYQNESAPELEKRHPILSEQEIVGNKNTTFGVIQGGNITIHYDSSNQDEYENDFQIVSLSTIARKPFPVIDVKLLNTKQSPVLIHKIELNILSSHAEFDELTTSPPLKTSHVYHMLINSLAPGSTARDASFLVNPNSADRFHIVVGANADRDGRVQVQGKLKLYYNKNEIIESESFNILIHLDHLFAPSKASEILNTDSYIQEIDKNLNAEEIEILGQLDLEDNEKREAEKIFTDNLKSNYIPILVESAAALSRIGNPLGVEYLLSSVEDENMILWKRIMSLRSLIGIGYFEPHVYIKLMKGNSDIMKLEILRVVGFLREKAVISDLIELGYRIDDVVLGSLKHYYFQHAQSSFLGGLDARRNYELEEIVRAIGNIGKPDGLDFIKKILGYQSTYRELSCNLLFACIEAIECIAGEEGKVYLQIIHDRLSNLFCSSNQVKEAVAVAIVNGVFPRSLYNI